MNFTDVNPFNNKIQRSINKSILRTVKNKDFILGKNVKKFEKKFSILSNSKYAIGCASGTDALLLALKSLNIGNNKNDEVITVSNTAIPTVSAIKSCGAKVKFVDVKNDNLINVDQIIII